MNVGVTPEWAAFKARAVAMLGRDGFADWLQHAADAARIEAKRRPVSERPAKGAPRA